MAESKKGGKLVRGEVLVIDENFGVRVTRF